MRVIAISGTEECNPHSSDAPVRARHRHCARRTQCDGLPHWPRPHAAWNQVQVGTTYCCSTVNQRNRTMCARGYWGPLRLPIRAEGWNREYAGSGATGLLASMVRPVLPRMRSHASAAHLTKTLDPIERGMGCLSTGSWHRPSPRSATASLHAIPFAPCCGSPADGSLRMASFCSARLVDQSMYLPPPAQTPAASRNRSRTRTDCP